MWILKAGPPPLHSSEQAANNAKEGNMYSQITLESRSKIPSTALVNHDFHPILTTYNFHTISQREGKYIISH